MDVALASLVSSSLYQVVDLTIRAREKGVHARLQRKAADWLGRVRDTQRVVLVRAINELESQIGHSATGKVCRFMANETGFAFTRHLFCAVLADVAEAYYEDYELELTQHFLLEDVGDSDSRTAAKIILAALQEELSFCAKKLGDIDPAIVSGISGRLMLERSSGLFDSFERTRNSLSGYSPGMVKISEDFLAKYRSVLRERLSDVTPAYVQESKRVSIESIYVPPRFSEEDDGPTSDLDYVLARAYRNVILGDPGAGKSTFSRWISYSACSQDNHRISTPFIVELRKFESKRKSGSFSVVDYISEFCNESLQLRCQPAVIEFLLVTGQASVIFDGLDELSTLADRRDIVSDVESFSSVYSRAIIIVTSRVVGYTEAPLATDFKKAYLRQFTEDDIRNYAGKWFSLQVELEPFESAKLASDFYNESAEVPDIRANPLMLSLLCTVYRGSRTIPRSRAELYEQCANLMFERWDSIRGITHEGPKRSTLRGAIRDIALWMYTTESLASGVPERKLRRRLSNFFMKRIDDEDAADSEANDLLNLCRGRAWILTDVGVDHAMAEPIYKFTHQTFLEYFAALELVRKNSDPDELWKELRPQIELGGWEVVAQVAIQEIEERTEGAADQIVSRLCDAASTTEAEESLNLIQFASKNLDTFDLSASSIRAVVRICSELFIRELASQVRLVVGEGPARWLDLELFGPELVPLQVVVSRSDERHLSVVFREIFEVVEREISSADVELAGIAALMALAVDDFVSFLFGGRSSEDSLDLARKLCDERRVWSSIGSRFEAISKVVAWVPLLAHRAGIIPLSSAIGSFCVESWFCEVHPFTGSFSGTSIAELAVLSTCDVDVPTGLDDVDAEEIISQIGHRMINSGSVDFSVFSDGRHSPSIATVARESAGMSNIDYLEEDANRKFDSAKSGQRSSDGTTVGCVLICCVLAEAHALQLESGGRSELRLGRRWDFGAIVACRGNADWWYGANAALRQLPLEPHIGVWLGDWMNGEVDFISDLLSSVEL